MASTRRIGKESSKTRALLLDATETLMLDEGYAAVSSRRVAATADVKPALVHYYFPTMDDLFVALFRRGAERNMERFERAARSDQPLRALWQLGKEQRDGLLVIEFAALSRHRTAIRAEIASFARKYRQLQVRTIRRVLEDQGIGEDVVTPEAVAVIMTGVATTMTLERELGLSAGHKQALALIDRMLLRYEPDPGAT
jgi:AcrR family transcriptional regulator